MNVLFDNIIFALQKNGGITNYWKSIISRAVSDSEINKYFIDFKKKGLTNNNISSSSKNTYLPVSVERFLNVKEQGVEYPFIFHSSYNRICLDKKAKNIITVHDLIHEKFINTINGKILTFQKKKSIQKSHKIITVSQSTKNDLLEIYPNINSNNISVIYNGVSEGFHKLNPFEEDNLLKDICKKPFLLFVGSRASYKNFDLAVKSISINKMLNLFIVGNKLSKTEIFFLNKYAKSRWFLFDNISEPKLNYLYNKAIALLYPSSYEGFGIPLLESMRTGCPFIAMNKSSLPEVAGNAGVLLNTNEIEEISLAIEECINNRNEIVNKGFIQVSKFSWEKCYFETKSLYKKLIEE